MAEIVSPTWRITWDWNENEEIIEWSIAADYEGDALRLLDGLDVLFDGVYRVRGPLEWYDINVGTENVRGYWGISGKVEWEAWDRLEKFWRLVDEREGRVV